MEKKEKAGMSRVSSSPAIELSDKIAISPSPDITNESFRSKLYDAREARRCYYCKDKISKIFPAIKKEKEKKIDEKWWNFLSIIISSSKIDRSE